MADEQTFVCHIKDDENRLFVCGTADIHPPGPLSLSPEQEEILRLRRALERMTTRYGRLKKRLDE